MVTTSEAEDTCEARSISAQEPPQWAASHLLLLCPQIHVGLYQKGSRHQKKSAEKQLLLFPLPRLHFCLLIYSSKYYWVLFA